jgi:hypothetical protein
MTDAGMVEVDRQDLEEALDALARVNAELAGEAQPWFLGAFGVSDGTCRHDASRQLTDLEARSVGRLQRALLGLPR